MSMFQRENYILSRGILRIVESALNCAKVCDSTGREILAPDKTDFTMTGRFSAFDDVLVVENQYSSAGMLINPLPF